ncbi:MAG: hypothetical protein NTX61_07275 [Bacteroidetes bacterium]|nr:hypothetical protein [Bacteroidota bacterium]
MKKKTHSLIFNLKRSHVLLFMLFVVMGCSPHGCKRQEAIRVKIFFIDQIPLKETDIFPQDIIEMLMPFGLDSNSKLYLIPKVEVTRIDTLYDEQRFENRGLPPFRQFVRLIFPLHPELLQEDIQQRFRLNKIGKDLTRTIKISDSGRNYKLMESLLGEYFNKDKRIGHIFYYSLDTNLKSFLLIPGKIELKVFHNPVDIQRVIATERSYSDQASGTGCSCACSCQCSCKSRNNSEYLIIYDPGIHHSEIRLTNPPGENYLCLSGGGVKIERDLGPFRTNIDYDSICWKLIPKKTGNGFSVIPESGSGKNLKVTFTRPGALSEGSVAIRVTPFKKGYHSKSADFEYQLVYCHLDSSLVTVTKKFRCPPEIIRSRLNVKRQKIIDEFIGIVNQINATKNQKEIISLRSKAIEILQGIDHCRVLYDVPGNNSGSSLLPENFPVNNLNLRIEPLWDECGVIQGIHLHR